MVTRWLTLLIALALPTAIMLSPAAAEQPKDKAKEEAALFKRAEAFVEAFHKGDDKALAGFWTPDGDFTDQFGKNIKGRIAIEKAFTELFAENKGLKLRINIGAVKFATADVAIEDGTTEVIPPNGGPPTRARYNIVYVKQDGQWFFESVRDAPFTAATNLEFLKDLEWAIGDWVEDSKEPELTRVAFAWSTNQNFIVASHAATFKNINLASGTEWIGWDPAAKQIRSWTFDDNGGFTEATWTKDGNKMVVKATTTMRGGKKLTSTNVIAKVDADNATWQSKDRMLDGKPLPEVPPVKMKRVK